MPLWQFLAALEGYRAQVDQVSAASVWTGYWSAYYASSNKSKKSPTALIEALHRKAEKVQSKHVDNVDVDAFLERERRFNEQLGR